VEGEIVVERRRQWTLEQKTALVAEVEAEGGRVLLVARRHGISASLLYNWRSAWKAAARARDDAARALPGFIQLGVVAGRSQPGPALGVTAGTADAWGAAPTLAAHAGAMEIDLPDGVRVRVDRGVDEAALRRVLSAVRGCR
jgi:transposase